MCPLDFKPDTLDRLRYFLALLANRQKNDSLWVYFWNLVGRGPFDGGCYMFARACQVVFGGTICTIKGYHLRGEETRKNPSHQHFVLRLAEDCYLDGDGISTFAKIRSRWRSDECLFVHSIVPHVKPEDHLICAMRMFALFNESDIPKLASRIARSPKTNVPLSVESQVRRLQRRTSTSFPPF